MKEFDRDYDVFYPYEKDEIVSGTRTFEDFLLPYCKSEVSISEILQTIPTLTILVPDWSWLDEDGFNVNTWDTTSDDIFVGISDDDCDHVLFSNGKNLGTVPAEIVPCSPVVIVKSNERMRMVTPSTKGSDAVFEFVDDVYDGSKITPETKTHDTTINWTYDKSGETNFAPEASLPSIVKDAYNQMGVSNTAAQRDYIYYGMTKTNSTSGKLDCTIREYVYRFKIDKSKLTILDYHNTSDAKTDPEFLPVSQVFKKKANKLSAGSNAIQKYLWSEGSLELAFTFYMGTYGSNVLSSYTVPLTVQPSELWEVKKSVEKRETCGTVFHYKYYSERTDLVSKWYYPKDFMVQPFDLSNNSTDIWFTIYEKDPSVTTERTISYTCKYTSNVKSSWNISAGIGGKDNDKWSLGIQTETSNGEENGYVTTYVLKYNEESEHLGDGVLNYMTPIINNPLYSIGGVRGYDLKPTPTAGGEVEINFVPKHIYD